MSVSYFEICNAGQFHVLCTTSQTHYWQYWCLLTVSLYKCFILMFQTYVQGKLLFWIFYMKKKGYLFQ